jgi:acyl-CoA reductase-like NAD-dependent aldehyde dehydrogenase
MPFDDFDEALHQPMTPPMVCRPVCSAVTCKAWRAIKRLDFGGVIINDVPTFRADHMPYGGVKESGIGREGVRHAIEDDPYQDGGVQHSLAGS